MAHKLIDPSFLVDRISGIVTVVSGSVTLSNGHHLRSTFIGDEARGLRCMSKAIVSRSTVIR